MNDLNLDKNLMRNLSKHKFMGLFFGILFGIMIAVGYAQDIGVREVQAKRGYINYRTFDEEVRAKTLISTGPGIFGGCLVIGLFYDGVMFVYRTRMSDSE